MGITCLLALPDNHDNAWFLSNAEREEAKIRTLDNQTGVDMQKVRFAFYRTICLFSAVN